MSATRNRAQAPAGRLRVLPLIGLAWFVLWCLTPGLRSPDPVLLLVHDEGAALLGESVLMLVLLIVIMSGGQPLRPGGVSS